MCRGVTGFLVVTWLVFPERRKQEWVLMFLCCTWLSLAPFFLDVVPTGDDRPEIQRNTCKSNVEVPAFFPCSSVGCFSHPLSFVVRMLAAGFQLRAVGVLRVRSLHAHVLCHWPLLLVACARIRFVLQGQPFPIPSSSTSRLTFALSFDSFRWLIPATNFLVTCVGCITASYGEFRPRSQLRLSPPTLLAPPARTCFVLVTPLRPFLLIHSLPECLWSVVLVVRDSYIDWFVALHPPFA
jgi:hypothetical protein